jgi:putative membrane protein
MMWSYGGVDWFWMVPMMVLFWGVVILVLVMVIRAVSSPRAGADPAMETLRKRLAAGEITPDDYDKIKHTLQ